MTHTMCVLDPTPARRAITAIARAATWVADADGVAAVGAHRDGADGQGSAEVRAVRAWRHTSVAVAALSLALAAVVAW